MISHLTSHLAHLYGHRSFALAFHLIPLPIWNLVPINVSINQGSGVCLSTASYPTLCSHLCLHCRTFCLLRHCHPYPSQRYPPSCFKFYFCHLPWVLSCSSSLSCHLSATTPETDHPAMYSTGRCVCLCFCFLPSSLSVFLCFFGLMYVFAFHLISFVALRVRIGSFGNSVLPFIVIIIIAFEGVNHIGEHIRDWFTGATLLIHHVVYYHSIGTWDFSFSGGSHS